MQKLTKYKQTETEAKWYVVDAENVRLGKLASEVSKLFLNKQDPGQVDYQNSGVRVIVLNSDKLSYFPARGKSKFYYRHSGFPGNLKKISLEEQMKKDSRKIVVNAVSGMLPKNKMRARYLAQLHVYRGGQHEQEAQKPVEINIK